MDQGPVRAAIRPWARAGPAFLAPKAFIFRSEKKSQKKVGEFVVCKRKRVVYLHPANEVAEAAESKEKRSCTDQKKKRQNFTKKKFCGSKKRLYVCSRKKRQRWERRVH
ncbi:hypothetical protein A9996_11725 [Gelidibacter algens]|nr:hypothetical protein A9996_11725 [Gelidibacter algens]